MFRERGVERPYANLDNLALEAALFNSFNDEQRRYFQQSVVRLDSGVNSEPTVPRTEDDYWKLVAEASDIGLRPEFSDDQYEMMGEHLHRRAEAIAIEKQRHAGDS